MATNVKGWGRCQSIDEFQCTVILQCLFALSECSISLIRGKPRVVDLIALILSVTFWQKVLLETGVDWCRLKRIGRFGFLSS